MTDITQVSANSLKYEYKKQQSAPEEEFEIEMDSAGYKAAVDKNKKGGGTGPAYVLQLSEEAKKRLEQS
jgi:hypothetical protein